MDRDKEKIKEKFQEYIIGTHHDDLIDIMSNYDPLLYYPVFIDLLDLLMSTEIQDFLTNATFYIAILDQSLRQCQKNLIEENPDLKLTLKQKIKARLVSLPEADGVFIKYPTCSDVNKLISFNGTVTKTCSPRLLESIQNFKCDKCSYIFGVEIDYTYRDLFMKPVRCLNKDCQSDKFKLVNPEKNLKLVSKDYQEIKVQEKLDMYSAGSVPRSVVVVLENDLVDCCKPGDDVTINAVVVRRWSRLINDMRCDVDLILHANYLKVNNEEQIQINITKEKEKMFSEFWKKYEHRPLTARNIILSSYCPQLYGMYIVKLAVCLVLAGGVSRNDSSGTRVRGESHLLLVGDPGTGKSQFLKYANKIVPKSILTTGIGSSSAGLTATASREGGIWHLEAGALVLADGGICCVDEFNCMKEQEKMSMLEAMEQQSISVAKAGIVCKLRTQCSVLAACNPKGSYDSNQPVTVNLAMSSPLLSRFDIILLLLDTPNKDWDHLASTFLLEGVDLLRKNTSFEFKPWDFDHLRLYLNYIKSLEPTLSQSANIVLQTSDDRNAARTTVRMLESIIRLSQAHAKLMLRNEVLVMDTIVAITLNECSINRTSSFGNVNILHTSFPEDAEIEYKSQAKLILGHLGLAQILQEEISFIEDNYEPFCSNENSIMNMSLHSLDIISQMIRDVPSQNLVSPIKEKIERKRKLEESTVLEERDMKHEETILKKKRFYDQIKQTSKKETIKEKSLFEQSQKISQQNVKYSQTIYVNDLNFNEDDLKLDDD